MNIYVFSHNGKLHEPGAPSNLGLIIEHITTLAEVLILTRKKPVGVQKKWAGHLNARPIYYCTKTIDPNAVNGSI